MKDRTMLSQTAETIATKTASAAQYGGGTVAMIGGWSANEIAAYGGLAVGIIGLAMNWWFKRQRLKLMQEHLELRKRRAQDPSDLGELGDV